MTPVDAGAGAVIAPERTVGEPPGRAADAGPDSADDAGPEPGPGSGDGDRDEVDGDAERPGGALQWRPPVAVWVAVALFGLVVALWTVAVPAYRAPDEAAHLDLVLYLAEGNGYPSWDGRFFGEALDLDVQRHLVDSRRDWPRFHAADAPPRHDRADVDDLGGVTPDADARPANPARPDHPYIYNQMPQHPPLYYLGMSTVLRVERWLLPGDERPSLDRELGLLRLANVLLIAPLPLLAWATVMQLTGGTDRRAGLVAALLPLGLPQLAHIGGSLNNDNLFVLLGGILCVLLAGVARGRRTRRTDLAVGLVLGLALLTKAFALMLVPWVVAAYLLHLWTIRRRRDSALGLAGAGGVTGLVGSWWWIANWVREGEPAPTTENLTRLPGQLPAGFHADLGEFVRMFAGDLVTRTWAWVGYRSPKFELDGRVVAVLTVGVAVAAGLAVWRSRAGRQVVVSPPASAPTSASTSASAPASASASVSVPRRVDVLLAWLPLVLLTLFVFRRAWGLYQTTALPAFIQGRYLFAALVGPMAVVGIGLSCLLRRGAAVTVLVVGAGLQAWMLTEVVQGSWSGGGRFGALAGALAWSPWPPVIVAAVGLLALTGVVVIAVDIVTGRYDEQRQRHRRRQRQRRSGVPAAAPTG